MAETWKVCTDRVPPRELMRPQRGITRSGRTRALSPIGKTWMNGTTLRARFLGGTPGQQATARSQAGWWTQFANIAIQFDNSPNAEIRIAFDPSDGAWSYIGTDSRQASNNEPTMNLGFLDGGTAGHEFGHALGLAHEHSSPMGGIEWDEAVVIAALAQPPNRWDEETTRHNVLRKYSIDQVNGTAFDPESIMLYFFPPEWTKNGIGTEANEVLSAMDKAFIASAKMYPRTGVTVTEATPLKVNASRRTSAEIGKFGEEDLFQFDAAKDGRYVIDTQGPSDVVMKLFGPNSPTALIAEDDDSGFDLNARVATDLVAGKYFVQIRHYNRESGKGKYSIKVRKT